MSEGAPDVSEFLVGYLAEVDEHLSTARQNVVAIDVATRKSEANPRAVRELFRALHTIKGLSAMVGAEPIVDIAHELESLLRTADRSGGQLPPRALDETTKGLRAIEERVAQLGRKEPLAPAPKELLDGLAALQFDAGPPRADLTLTLEEAVLSKVTPAEQDQLIAGLRKGLRALRVDFIPSQERHARGVNITSVRARIGALGELVKVVPRSVQPSPTQPGTLAFALLLLTQATNEEVATAAETTADSVQSLEQVATQREEEPAEFDQGARNVIRVDVERLDDALELVGTLMVTRSRLQRTVQRLTHGEGQLRDLLPILGENARQLRDLRGAIMRARMVPVAQMLERTPLLVRGLSRSSHKEVKLELDAGKAELDKSVADRLSPVIVHLVRNAVDHAIESPEERRARGKAAEGSIRITSYAASGSHLSLVVSDDGRGIDVERVARKAGVPAPSNDAELLALISRPGLSTLDSVTHTSGRGIGMDIVKRVVVDELGGQLQLRTVEGQGTSFTLTVPLSVTIFDALSFISAERTFVVPVTAVEDLVELRPDRVSCAPAPGGVATVRLLEHKDALLPLFRLSTMLGFPEVAAPRPKAIIVSKEQQRFALEVDQMLSQQEVVVRPLTDVLVKVPGIAGTTDLGDGQPTLVLDLVTLVEHAERAPRPS